jgi:hypothetical protein
MAMYDVNGNKVTHSSQVSERDLEDRLEQHPHMLLDEPLTIISRQHTTDEGKRPDLIAVDGGGNLVVVELKKDRAPRDVLAQTLGYLAWARELDEDAINLICADYKNVADEAASFFLNPEGFEVRAVMVATYFDPETERTLRMLAEAGIPIEARYYGVPSTGGLTFDDAVVVEHVKRPKTLWRDAEGLTASQRWKQWDGESYYHVLGFSGPRGRMMADALTYNFISSGDWADEQGTKGSHTGLLASMPVGATVYCYGKTPEGKGYYGVALIEETARNAAEVEINSTPFHDLPLSGQYCGPHDERPNGDDEEFKAHSGSVEYVAKVRWLATRDVHDPIPARLIAGAYAQQAPCAIRRPAVVDSLKEAFGL